MPEIPESSPRNEPRFNPMWWWVIGAFVFLIGGWTTIYLIAKTHPVEEVPLRGEPSAETAPDQPSAPAAAESPAG